jgi:MFS family permease
MARYSVDLRSILNRGAVSSLILSRTVYAVNWYNVASVFAFIAFDFDQNISGLGILTASFYIGLGIFQVPGGIIAAKIGPRKTAFYGMLLASVSVFLTAITSGFYQFVILRFLVGVGMALFFGPGVALVTNYFRRGSEGFGLGIFNGAFYIGGSLGLFAWSILADFAGWRASLGASGALGILGAFLLLVYVPKDEWNTFAVKAADLRRILSDKWLLLLSLELFGLGSGSILITTFMVFYLEQSLNLSAAFAGAIGSLTPLCAVFASPFFGMLYDRTRNARMLLFLSGSALAAAIGLVSIGNVYSAVLSTVIAGFGAGTLTVAYLAARETRSVSFEYQALSVGWVNNIQMFAGFWSPLVFSALVISVGYADSWLIAAMYTFVLISVILLARDKKD